MPRTVAKGIAPNPFRRHSQRLPGCDAMTKKMRRTKVRTTVPLRARIEVSDRNLILPPAIRLGRAEPSVGARLSNFDGTQLKIESLPTERQNLADPHPPDT
jgi:hypothetical protein